MRASSIMLIAAVVAALAACAEPGDTAATSPASATLAGDWVLAEGIDVVDGYPVTLSIDGTTAGGRSACNSYGARVVLDGSAVRFDQVSSTDMGCDPAVMDVEAAYVDALVQVRSWSIASGQLQLDGPTPLVFDPRPAVPTEALVDTTWTLESLVSGDTVQSVHGQPATLVLLSDGTLTAGTGCRTLSGRWVQSGAEVFLPELAADGDCPADLAGQDNHVVSVLGDGFTAQVDGNVLTVTSMGDKGLVYRAWPADDSDDS
ncbi:MAG: META domain-containing protein [Candidatus Nanopelagicales bacterium]